MTVADKNLIDSDENPDVPPHPGRRMTEEEFVEIPSSALPGFYIKPAWILSSPLPRVSDILREMAS
jgi:hypothetical protein